MKSSRSRPPPASSKAQTATGESNPPTDPNPPASAGNAAPNDNSETPSNTHHGTAQKPPVDADEDDHARPASYLALRLATSPSSAHHSSSVTQNTHTRVGVARPNLNSAVNRQRASFVLRPGSYSASPQALARSSTTFSDYPLPVFEPCMPTRCRFASHVSCLKFARASV